MVAYPHGEYADDISLCCICLNVSDNNLFETECQFLSVCDVEYARATP